MKNVCLLLIIFLFLSISIQAQVNNNVSKKTLPKSIYALSYFPTHKISAFSGQKSFQLPSYDFVFVDFDDLEDNSFSLNLKNIWKKPTRLIHDDYARYNKNLGKGFLRKHDPTRWLQPIVPSDLIVPN